MYDYYLTGIYMYIESPEIGWMLYNGTTGSRSEDTLRIDRGNSRMSLDQKCTTPDGQNDGGKKTILRSSRGI